MLVWRNQDGFTYMTVCLGWDTQKAGLSQDCGQELLTWSFQHGSLKVVHLYHGSWLPPKHVSQENQADAAWAVGLF